jgi:hypothetical protein
VTLTFAHRATDIEVGDFIRVPAWGVSGQVVGVQPSALRYDVDADDVLLQDRPEGWPRTYRLAPGEYVNETAGEHDAPTLTVVETAKLTPALIEMLNERGALRVPVPTR